MNPRVHAPAALLLLLAALSGAAAQDLPKPSPASWEAPYVILLAAHADADFRAAAETIASLHPHAQTVEFDPAQIDGLLPELRRIAPARVCLVAPREAIDVRFARRLFLLSTRVDDDPFPDFSYGIVTGDDGAHALAFARAIARNFTRERKRSVLEVMTREGDKSSHGTAKILGDVDHAWLSLAADDPDIESGLPLLAGRDLILVTAHGHVGGMGGGYWSTHLDHSAPELDGAMVVSSVCYSGAIARYFEVEEGKVVESPVEPADSFALAFLRRGASAYVGGADGMHGVYSCRIYAALLVDGATLGDAVRALQDRMVLEMLDRGYDPARILDLERLDADQAIATVANLVVYGDPGMRLYPARPSRTTARTAARTAGESGGVLRMAVTIGLEEFEAFERVHSKYRSQASRWGTECAFDLDWTGDVPPAAVRVKTANVAAMVDRSAFFALEKDGAARVLHLCVVYEADADAVTAQVAKEGYRFEIEIEAGPQKK